MSRKCKSCGKKWEDHPGIILTCSDARRYKELAEIFERQLNAINRLEEKADAASWMEQCEDARDLALSLGRDSDKWKEVAGKMAKILDGLHDDCPTCSYGIKCRTSESLRAFEQAEGKQADGNSTGNPGKKDGKLRV